MYVTLCCTWYQIHVQSRSHYKSYSPASYNYTNLIRVFRKFLEGHKSWVVHKLYSLLFCSKVNGQVFLLVLDCVPIERVALNNY